MANRNPKNKWVKGCPSPNPGGRPATNREVRERAKTMTNDVLTVFHDMLMDPKMHPMARIAAGKEINDRAMDKAPQARVNFNAELDGNADGSGLSALLARARLEQLNAKNKAKTIEHAKPNGQWRAPDPKPEPVEPEPEPEPVVAAQPEPKPDPKPVILTRIPDPAPPPPPPPPKAAQPAEPPPKYERVPGTNRVRRVKCA